MVHMLFSTAMAFSSYTIAILWSKICIFWEDKTYLDKRSLLANLQIQVNMDFPKGHYTALLLKWLQIYQLLKFEYDHLFWCQVHLLLYPWAGSQNANSFQVFNFYSWQITSIWTKRICSISFEKSWSFLICRFTRGKSDFWFSQ